jgi:hypothetical protein
VLVSSGLILSISSSQEYSFVHRAYSSVLRELSEIIQSRFACQHSFRSFFRARFSGFQKNSNSAKISKQHNDLRKSVAEPELPIFNCSGLGLGAAGSFELLQPRTNAWTALRLAVNAPTHVPAGLRREAYFLLIQSTAGCFALQPLRSRRQEPFLFATS